VRHFSHSACATDLSFYSKDQDQSVLASLGEGSNAIVWPRAALDEEEDVDVAEAPNNQRLMRIGSV
jgi:hypothetical protein